MKAKKVIRYYSDCGKGFWKKQTAINHDINCKCCKNETIVKLQITEDSQRSSSTSFKCRASKAVVLSIENKDGSKYEHDSVCSNYDSKFTYKIGETIEVSDYDANRWNECSTGIHFFMSKEMAK